MKTRPIKVKYETTGQYKCYHNLLR